jgi:hypothetical protein
MKQLLLAITVAAAGWLGSTTSAEADIFGHRKVNVSVWVSGYAPCGDPIYVQRVFVGYDRYGDPVFETRVLPIVHHCYRPDYDRPVWNRHRGYDRDGDRDDYSRRDHDHDRGYGWR